MQHKIDELFKNAGFLDRAKSLSLESLFDGRGQSNSAGQEAGQQSQQLESLATGNTRSSSIGFDTTDATNDSQSSSSSGFGSSLTSAAGNLFGGGSLVGSLFGGGLLGDLFSGLTSLFGGGPSQPPTPVQYMAPQSQDFELATGGGKVGDAVYNQQGDPRVASVSEPALSGLQYLGGASGSGGDSSSNNSTSGTQSAPQITLNVQAMDSQSFLDRSQDIAQAVRQAMLNMHSINDVINDL